MHELPIYFVMNTYLSHSSCIKYDFWGLVFLSQTDTNYIHETPIYFSNNTYFSHFSCVLNKSLGVMQVMWINFIYVRNIKRFSILTLLKFMYYVFIFCPITKLIVYKGLNKVLFPNPHKQKQKWHILVSIEIFSKCF